MKRLAMCLIVLGLAATAATADAAPLPAEIVFTCRQVNTTDGHWYANFAHYMPNTSRKGYRAGGRLCKLDTTTGKVTVLLDDLKGSIRDPQIHYDARKILFSWRKAGTEYFNLYEIGVDGAGLRQITTGPWDDFEATYVPDGGIIFSSSRCKRWVNCYRTQVATLHRCDADGTNIRRLSANIEQDNTPWPLPDGRILYMRWEYIDRSQVGYHHLWTMNPDGTGQMVYYGNQQTGTVMIDAKPIPGTNRVVSVFSPNHGRREHEGVITIVTPAAGPDERASARPVNKGNKVLYRDPYPLSANRFLVARGTQILEMDGRGKTKVLYGLPKELAQTGMQVHEPSPLRARPREQVIASQVDLQRTTGRLILSDIYDGRNMKGVERGEIKKLLVLETLPKPVGFFSGMEPISYGGTFTMVRTLGTVPVNPDGTAYMELPARRPLFFVAMDAENNAVKRMQSFLTVMPGETVGCVGCHEQRTRTPINRGRGVAEAMRKPPSTITPLAGIPDVFDFPRDIQPILDRHCVKCHDYDDRSDGVILTSDRGPTYSHSFYTLTILGQFVDGRNRFVGNLPPRSIGASASPLMKKIAGAHNDVKLSGQETDTIRYWIEAGAPYAGTYAALGTGQIGDYSSKPPKINRYDLQWPSVKAATNVLKRRCASCHTGKRKLPTSPTDNHGFTPWTRSYVLPGGDWRIRWSRHRFYNLSRPTKSLLLLAPLATKAGGYGMQARDKAGKPTGKCVEVFASADDPDYQKLLAMVRDAAKQLEKIKRFDMPGFRPHVQYVNQMKRYGVLPASFDAARDPIDVYETDRAYWRSLWWQPERISRDEHR